MRPPSVRSSLRCGCQPGVAISDPLDDRRSVTTSALCGAPSSHDAGEAGRPAMNHDIPRRVAAVAIAAILAAAAILTGPAPERAAAAAVVASFTPTDSLRLLGR